jgi:hypothetical protein
MMPQAALSRPSPAPQTGGLPALARGHLHEIHATADGWAAAVGFVLSALGPAGEQPVMLVRAKRSGPRLLPCGAGWAQTGLDPRRLVVVEAPDALGMLRAGLDAARCPGLAAVVLETWGPLPDYDLTASRRLVLAAERSGALVIVLRGDAPQRASAAQTRWQIDPGPSLALPGQAPGYPALSATLLRQRGGASGQSWPCGARHGKEPSMNQRMQSSRRRCLALWFPFLPCERTIRSAPPEPGQPFALVAVVGQALRLAALTADDAGHGLAVGMTLADARARCPDLLTAPHDPHEDAKLLAVLARRMGRFTPMVALDPPDGLVLDITGCAHLFGGEAALARLAMAEAGLTARPAMADHAAAARALARYERGQAGGEEGLRIRALPIAALELSEASLSALRRAGLKTLGDLASRPMGLWPRASGKRR